MITKRGRILGITVGFLISNIGWYIHEPQYDYFAVQDAIWIWIPLIAGLVVVGYVEDKWQKAQEKRALYRQRQFHGLNTTKW